MGGVDSMGFESILVSKGLPHAEFSEKCVIDAHRSITSHNDVRHLTSGAIRSSRGEFGRLCLYTRKRLPRSGFVQTGIWEVTARVRSKTRSEASIRACQCSFSCLTA